MMNHDQAILEAKQKLGVSIPFEVEILSPVHIGNGEKLVKGFDYYEDNASLYLVAKEKVFEFLSEAENSSLINEYENNAENILQKMPNKDKVKFSIPSFYLENKSINQSNTSQLGAALANINLSKTSSFPSEISEFECNGQGLPYIPGSSIKGSIRTALLWCLWEGLDTNTKRDLLWKAANASKKNAADGTMNYIFHSNNRFNPNTNFLRQIQVGDVHFTEKDTKLTIVKSANLKRHGFDYLVNEKPSDFACLALPVSTKSKGTLKIDEFLSTNNKAIEELDLKVLTTTRLTKSVNAFSAELIKKEMKYFDKDRAKFQSIITFYTQLQQQIEKLTDDECIMRIGFGSGWRFMTGDNLTEAEFFPLRKEFKLGKPFMNSEKTQFTTPFPKTRRLVFNNSNGEKPETVCGWIKISLKK